MSHIVAYMCVTRGFRTFSEKYFTSKTKPSRIATICTPSFCVFQNFV